MHNVQSGSSWDETPAPLPVEQLIERYHLHDDDDPIYKAAYKGEVTEELIKSTGDINSRSYTGITPLHLAIRADRPKAVRMLLAAGADTSLKDELDSAYQLSHDALHLAAHLGAHESLAILLDHGIAVDAEALCLSASRNHVNCLRVLVEKMGQEGFSDGSKEDGINAALEKAALCWHTESVEFLLGCAPMGQQGLGRALILALCDYDCDDRCRWLGKDLFKVLDLLIAAGAAVDSNAFWTCLRVSAVPRKVVQFLIDHGLRVPAPPGEVSLLFGIIRDTEDDPSFVKALIQAGENVSGIDSDLNTPLHLTVHRSFAKLLIEHGADVCARNSEGKTPLHTACEQGLLGVAELLIEQGASVHDTTTNQRWTPLMFASGNREELVELLLGKGANPCAAAVDGLTPLHHAARSGKIRIVEQLITGGADVRATTMNGETVLHAACSFQYMSVAQATTIAKCLVDSGADVDTKDNNGATPLFMALDFVSQRLDAPSTDFINFLIERNADLRAEDKHGERAIDLIDFTKWELNDSGLLQQKDLPHEVFTEVVMPW